VNVYRAAAECLEKSKNANAKEKTMEKALNRWCWENFINHRSLRHARDVHRLVIILLFCFNGRLELLGRIKIKNDDMQLSILNLVEKTAQTFEHSWLVHGTRRGKPKGCLKQCAMDQWSQHSSMTWISNIST
jgi:hypothetical protein